MAEKKRRIDIREWFSDLEEDEHTQLTQAHPPSLGDSDTIPAQIDRPTQPRNEQLFFDISPIDQETPISTGKLGTSFLQKARQWLEGNSLLRRIPRAFLINALLIFLVCAFLFGLIWFVTIWGARDETIGGLIKYLYLLTVLAFVPYLFFLIHPFEKQKVLMLSVVVLIGGLFFHLRLLWLGDVMDRYPFLDQFFYFYDVLIAGFITLLGIWIRQNWKDRAVLLKLIKGIRLAYPTLFIVGFILIGLVNRIF